MDVFDLDEERCAPGWAHSAPLRPEFSPLAKAMYAMWTNPVASSTTKGGNASASDRVWHVTSPRVLELARHYFGCASPGAGIHSCVQGQGCRLYARAVDLCQMFARRAVRGRVIVLACLSSPSRAVPGASLEALPLMGGNQIGVDSRDSHWETRIMNDEIMAYGQGSALSSLTLALMEDLGFYVANYSGAECMFWGRGQGCEFVRSRCGRSEDAGQPTR
jgi:hypothetical protein